MSTVYGNKTRSVSFSLDKVDERALYEVAVTMPNFSSWVKRHLAMELRRRQQQKERVAQPE